jgi:hypothetical protein
LRGSSTVPVAGEQAGVMSELFTRKNTPKSDTINDNMPSKNITTEIAVAENIVGVLRVGKVDYISLTDIARKRNPIEPKDVVKNWMRSKFTIEFIGLWEKLKNSKVKGVEIDSFTNEAGSHHFTMSPQRWISETNAIGFISKSGKNGGTYAHPDIAFEFASWISPTFKMYLIHEFERLKQNEAYHNQIIWSAHREIAKTNYLIHTKAIKDNIVPKLTEKQKLFVYADEADMLNVVLFGITAKQWREQNPDLAGNIRDYASDSQLRTLINMENANAQLIKEGKSQKERMVGLHELAREQMEIFNKKEIKKLVGS